MHIEGFLLALTNADKDGRIVINKQSKYVDRQVVLSSPLMHIEGFLLALTNADKDGRIVINKQSRFDVTFYSR